MAKTEAASPALGVVGVGAIAEAIVTGLCEGANSPPSIRLSPRGAGRSGRLAARHPSVEVAESNRAVVEGADVVLVCVRPQDASEALSDLSFGAGQTVISVMAGIQVEALRALVAPAEDIVRTIPLPAVARRAGLTAIHPRHERARALFEPLGGVVEVEDEHAFDALSAATATIAAHLAYLDTISGWLAEQGIPEAEAARYVAAVFESVPAGSSADEYATPGGTNEQFLGALRGAGTFDAVKRALDDVARRLG